VKDPSASSIKWFRQQLSSWGEANLRDFPWRKTSNPYHLLVAESLLQKTDAQTVAPIYTAFLARYPTIEELAAANPNEVNQLLQPLGLLFRAERLHQCANIILSEYAGKVPDNPKQLLKLPGVGEYTARAIASQAFDRPLAVLDTNVARIIERFWGLRGERVKSRCKILWGAADLIAPKKGVGRWNLTLLDFGAMVCKAQNPSCQVCPLLSRCDWCQTPSQLQSNR
jgi:A/G-specific adenine glycosylase